MICFSQIFCCYVQLLMDALHVAGGIGALYLTGVTHSAIAKYPGPFAGGVAKENLVNAVRRVATRAQDLGVVLGLEIVNRYESNVLNTATQVCSAHPPETTPCPDRTTDQKSP